MNTSQNIAATVLVFIALSACSQNVDKQLSASQIATKELAKNLQSKLKSSLQSNGPIDALTVCNVEAEKIALAVSNSTQTEVGRTSLKTRNPSNIPDTWEEEVLRDFEAQKQSGKDVKNLEHYEITKDSSGKWFRYMKAIPTSEVCLICHGENIAPNIQEKIHSLYPNDQAVGYKAGDLRGAFSVKIKY